MSGTRKDGSPLAIPASENVSRSKSPSLSAAVAAASRAATTKAGVSPAMLERKGTLTRAKPVVAAKPAQLSTPAQAQNAAPDSPTDTTSIAPTTSLVSLFEQRTAPTTRPSPKPIATDQSNFIPITSPKPTRHDGIRPILQAEMGSDERTQVLPPIPSKENARAEVVAPEQNIRGSDRGGEDRSSERRRTQDDVYGQLQRPDSLVDSAALRNAASAGERDSLRHVGDAAGIQHTGDQSGQDVLLRTATQNTITASRGPPLPPRKPVGTDTTTAADLRPLPLSRTPTAPITIRPPARADPADSDHLSSSARSSQSVSATYRQLYPRTTISLKKDDELANAIVASSLASSRLSSPSRKEAPPPPPARRPSRHGFFHSRTPSPSKGGLRQTLRKQDSSTSDGEDDTHPYQKHRKKRLIRKHPNKHHEGDRKRWRDALTENERKRYEGVWAANKGLHMPPLTDDSVRRIDLNDQVSNVVTRDIWNRSRLPDFELEVVWDLVDTQNAGRLTKEEFVVGLWLIDQRLKGFKLPVKVTPTVWASVRGLQGLKVPK